MKLYFIAPLLFLAGCVVQGSVPKTQPTPSPAPSASVAPSPIPSVTPSVSPEPSPSASPSPQELEIRASSTNGFTDSEVTDLNIAMAMMQVIMNGKCFHDGLLAAQMTETLGLTNQEILDRILSGATWWKGPDHIMELELVMYYSKYSRTMGYVNTDDPNIYINYKYYTDPETIGSLLAHEYSHQEGFTHYGTLATSVPYTINKVFEACGSNEIKTTEEMFMNDSM
jgi:hypothetical protein